MTKLLDRLTTLLTRLPGIGRKTAQRISFYLLKMDPEEVRVLAEAMTLAKAKLRLCRVCFNFTEAEVCEICADSSRDSNLIAVVEDAGDIVALERSRGFRGLYHVLGGALSPLDGIGPDDLRFKELVARVEKLPDAEVIAATNPTTEGEATAAYLARILKRPNIRVSRIARGLPIGSDLDLADEVTLARALEGRREMS